MKTHSGGAGLRRVVIVCLAALFALLAMGVTLMGTGVYRAVADDAAANSAQRTALSYVVNQIRRADGGRRGRGHLRRRGTPCASPRPVRTAACTSP